MVGDIGAVFELVVAIRVLDTVFELVGAVKALSAVGVVKVNYLHLEAPSCC